MLAATLLLRMMHTVNSHFHRWSLLAVVFALLGVATHISAVTAEKKTQSVINIGFGDVPTTSIRAVAIQTGMTVAVLTDSELLFFVDSYGMRGPAKGKLRFPLGQIVSMEATKDAYGVRQSSRGGIRLQFDRVITKNPYTDHDLDAPTAMAFDVYCSSTVKNGLVIEVVENGRDKNNTIAAEHFLQLIASAKGKAKTPPEGTQPGSLEEKLTKLKSLLDKGLIDKATYDAKVAEIMKQL